MNAKNSTLGNCLNATTKIGLISAIIIMSFPSVAEVKYETFDEDLAQANSLAQSLGAKKSSNQVAEFDKEKLLRCWQEGQLISTDTGWKPANSQAHKATFRKGNQEMFLYEFGETFCIYTGE